jgi:hypothetical protein
MISMIPALTGTWPMMVDVDVQLACDADDLPPGGEQIAGQIEQWVQSTLDFPGVDWHRGLP